MRKNVSWKKFAISIVSISVIFVGVIFFTYGAGSTITIEPDSFATEHSYIVDKDGSNTFMRNGGTGEIDWESTNSRAVIQACIDNITYGSVFIKRASSTYVLDEPLVINDKKIIVDGNFPEIQAPSNNYTIIINCGGNQGLYQATIKHLRIDGNNYAGNGIKLIDSFMTTVDNVYFYLINIGFDIGSKDTWTECTEIKNVFLRGCKRGIYFSNRTGTGTGSRICTRLDHIFFQLSDNTGARGILATNGSVLDLAGGYWTDLDFTGTGNDQTYISLNCTVHNLQINALFHPSATGKSNVYGIEFGSDLYGVPTLDNCRWHSGAGRFTEKIKNDHNKNFLIVGKDTIWGLLTENSGTASNCVNGSWVSHGLVSTPNITTLTISGSNYINSTCYLIAPTVIASNSTHFQIGFYINNAGTIKAVTSTDQRDICWIAEYKP